MKRFLSQYEKLMRRTVNLSVVAAALMFFLSAVDLYSVLMMIAVAESRLVDLLSANPQTIFLPMVVAAFLIRGYILLSSSGRPYCHILLSGLLVLLISGGYYGSSVWADWLAAQPTDCVPTEGKICFVVYANRGWVWSEVATFFYPILALVRSLTTAVWAAMKYQYK